jgi:hypothetical protein
VVDAEWLLQVSEGLPNRRIAGKREAVKETACLSRAYGARRPFLLGAGSLPGSPVLILPQTKLFAGKQNKKVVSLFKNHLLKARMIMGETNGFYGS